MCNFFAKGLCEKGGSAGEPGGEGRGCRGFCLAWNRVSNLHLGRGGWKGVEFVL